MMPVAIAGTLFLALGMGFANAAVFKLVPQEIPDAVGGAADWVGGLGTFGGFVLPPLLGVIVRNQGVEGYSQGFIVFSILSALAIFFTIVLRLKKKKSV